MIKKLAGHAGLFSAAIAMLAGIQTAGAQEYRQLSSSPTIYVETENNVEITSKEDYVRATLRYVDDSGVKLYDALGIRGRGNSTWGLEKKPYRIKFDKKQEFLGPDKANAKSWTLLANYADKSLIRNAVAACIGEFAGLPFNASAQFVDFVLNGEYLGCYQVSDQMEIREKRVDITEQEDPMTDTSDITGGYFLEVDGFAYQEPAYFVTDRGVAVTIKSPDEEIIDQRQIAYIRDHMNKFENALFSDDFTDPEKGYRQYVDSLTLASWYVASELTGNPDCFWSTYMYKEKGDDRFYWGPLWDYDIAFNNCDRVGDVSRELMLNKGFADDLTKLWVKRMWQDPWFVNLIDRTWRSLVEKGIEEHVIAYIDRLAAEIDGSQKLNFEKWPINRHDYNELVLFNTYGEGIEYLKKFIRDHCAYLTEVFAAAAEGADAPVPARAFSPDYNYYYLVKNCGNDMYAAGSDGSVVMSGDASKAGQWVLEDAGDGWMRLVNRESGMAITDNASLIRGKYQPGAHLVTSEADPLDETQMWKADPLSTANHYAIVNRKTDLAWNNSGGSSAEGNPVLSWTNNGENNSKPTRQWRLVKDELRETSAVTSPSAVAGISMTYSRSESLLRFTGCGVKGEVTVCTPAGAVVLHTALKPEISLEALPAGFYLVSWQTGGFYGSAKLAR